MLSFKNKEMNVIYKFINKSLKMLECIGNKYNEKNRIALWDCKTMKNFFFGLMQCSLSLSVHTVSNE